MRQMPNLFPYLQPHVLVCKYGIYHLCPTFTLQFLFFIYLFIYFFFWAKYSVQGENLCNKLGWARATPTLVSIRGLILFFDEHPRYFYMGVPTLQENQPVRKFRSRTQPLTTPFSKFLSKCVGILLLKMSFFKYDILMLCSLLC